jgi:DNA-binding GntR family transcriptional regulator
LTNPMNKPAVPAYLRIASALKAHIERGDYLPGDRLPSESKLSKQYNVSPMTARRATQALLDQDIICAIKGSGTYVKAPDLRNGTFSMEEFYNIFSDKDRTKVKILEALIIKADAVIAEKLALNPGDRTILIRRLLIRDGEPLIYHREYLIYDPELRIVETELEVTSLRGLFVGKEAGMLKSGQLSMEATVLAKDEADLLNTHTQQPAFRLEHLFFNYEDKPVSWGRFICRGDRFRFTTSLGHFKKDALAH